MNEMMKTMAASASGMAAQAARLRLCDREHRQRRHARLPAQDGVVRGDLPAHRRRARGGDRAGAARPEPSSPAIYDPTHPLAGPTATSRARTST